MFFLIVLVNVTTQKLSQEWEKDLEEKDQKKKKKENLKKGGMSRENDV